MARIDTLTNFLTDVASAIKTKKGDDTPIQASQFDTEITNLPSGETDIAISNYSYLFYGNARLDIKDILLSLYKNVTDIRYMFFGCTNLIELDLRNFEVGNAQSMLSVFQECKNLLSLNLNNLNTQNINSMQQTFYSCSNLVDLDMSNCDTSKVTNMNNAFAGCTKLSNLKIKVKNCNFNVSVCPLSEESVAYILQNLGTVTTTRTLTLGSTNLAKATEEDIASATTKGWTLN